MARTVKQYKGKVKKPKRLRVPWSIRIVELLAERGEMSEAELIAEAGPLIPPGRARRRREKDRARNEKSRKGRFESSGPRLVSIEMQIEYGRREIIRWTLYKLTESARLDRRLKGKTKFYRLGEVERAHRKAAKGGRAGS